MYTAVFATSVVYEMTYFGGNLHYFTRSNVHTNTWIVRFFLYTIQILQEIGSYLF